MKKMFLAASLLLYCSVCLAAGPVKELKDVRYGDHERCLLDLYLPESAAAATPLVIYVHGGGFHLGDKKGIQPQMVKQLTDAGIAVASVNYRLATGEPTGALACIGDSRRALQFLRYHAAEYNLDPTRVGMYGGSAGAGTSLWIAFHTDMADPSSADPVLRQSTRLQAVGAMSTQSSYDFLQYPEIYGYTPDNLEVSKFFREDAVRIMGAADPDDMDSERVAANRAQLDMYAMMTGAAPPMFLQTVLPGDIPATTWNNYIHHPLHAKRLKEKAEQLGVEVEAVVPAYDYQSRFNMATFFISILK